jgi:osmotically-inducible protein OsmY
MKRLVSVVSGLAAGAGVAFVWRRRRIDDSPGAMSLVGRWRAGERDAILATRVRHELFGDEPVPIVVSVDRGAVTLRGEVDDLADIRRLDAMARQVDGVKDVINLLRLRQAASL